MKVCSVADCGKEVLARSFCQKHYVRWSKHGNPLLEPMTALERFWAKISKTDGCWNWIGSTAGGYGQVTRATKKIPAHRMSWELHFGGIPDGLMVLHRCDNKLCVRPDHLFLGDASANMRDMVAKGKHPKKLNSYRAKLTPDQVSLIRKSDKGCTHFARLFGVDQSTILAIKKGQSWRRLSEAG